MPEQGLQRDMRDVKKGLNTVLKQMEATRKLHEQMLGTIAHELRCIREAVAPVQSGESTTTDARENNTSHGEDDVSSAD